MNVPPFGISCLSSVFSIGRLSIGNPKCYLFIFHVYMKYMYTYIYCVYTDIFCKHTQPIYYVLHIHMPIFSVYTETHIYCIYIDTYCIHTHTHLVLSYWGLKLSLLLLTECSTVSYIPRPHTCS